MISQIPYIFYQRY